MKVIFLIFSLSILSMITSCGKVRSQKFGFPGKLPGGIAGLEEPVAGNLTKDDLQIATRICGALTQKRLFIQNSMGATPPKRIGYSFEYLVSDCGSVVTPAKNILAEIVSVSGELEYNSADTKYNFLDVVTDNSPFIKYICSSIAQTETKLEDKQIENTKIFANKIFVSKFSVDKLGFDTLQVSTKVLNDKKGYDALDTQVISFYTKEAQATEARNIGVEKERKQFISCSGSDYTTKTENFVRSVFI